MYISLGFINIIIPSLFQWGLFFSFKIFLILPVLKWRIFRIGFYGSLKPEGVLEGLGLSDYHC